MGLSSFRCLASLLLPLFATACSIDLVDDSAGEMGNARFSYQSLECLFGCSLDRPALQGSTVSIRAEGRDSNFHGTPRLTGSPVGTVGGGERNCGGNPRVCSVSFDITTTAAGDAKLEIVDPQGKVVDQVTFRVRPAARIDVSVQSADMREANGVYEVKRFAPVLATSRVYDADGAQLIFMEHGLSSVYSDEKIMRPATEGFFAFADMASMLGVADGETTVKIVATGAESALRFRVVP